MITLEERKDNTYYDQTGKQILVGDLLRVFHYRIGRRAHYMHHVVVMEETKGFPVMAAKAHYADKPHYRLFQVSDKQKVIQSSKIIGEKDWETKRLRVKPTPGPAAEPRKPSAVSPA